MTRKTIHTDAAPKAVGPYAQAVRTGSLLFVSGQVALDPATGALVDGGIEDQTRRVAPGSASQDQPPSRRRTLPVARHRGRE
jgi:2-iminobutanoate/2-iminopropanoate deaminase